MGKQIPVISTQCPECGHTSYHNEDCGEGDVKPALRRAVERANLITDNAQLRAQLTEALAELEEARVELTGTKAYMVDLDMWHEKAKSELTKARAEIDQLNNLLTAAYMKLDQLDEPAPEWTAEEWEAFKKEHGIVSYRIKYTHGDGR